MNVVFCHDGPIQRDRQGDYYGVSHSEASLSRYFTIAEQVKFLVRITHTEVVAGLEKISGDPQLSFIETPNLKVKPHTFFERKKIIEDTIEQADYVVCRLPSMNGITASKIALRKGKPLVVEIVAECFGSYWNHSLLGKIVAPYSFFSVKSILRKAQYVSYVTEEYLQKTYSCEGNTLHCSNVMLGEVQQYSEINKKTPIPQGSSLVIGTIGAINVNYKGHKYVFKALKNLKRKGYSNILYRIVGGGSPARLKKLAKRLDILDMVEILGTIPHTQIFDFLKEIDLYVHPSLREGLPRSVIEAMSVGTEVIAADAGGIHELLQEEAIFSAGNKGIPALINHLIQQLSGEGIDFRQRNLEKAATYRFQTLEKKRADFFTSFKEKSLE